MSIDKTESAQGFQRPKTTRRYLQGPLAERLIVFYREGKIVHGEMCHEKDWHRWKYVCQPAMGVWLVHGDGDESFDFQTARLRVDPEGVPIHGQSWRVGGMEVDLEACSPVERVPSAHVRLRVSNRGEAPIDEKIGFVVRNSQEKMPVQASPDIYRIYNPRVRTWKGLECEWRREGDVLSLQDLFVSFRSDAPAEWDMEEGTLRFRAADYEAHDVAAHCETLAMPLVFAHGGADEIMPVSEMEDIRSRMAGRPNARFETIPGGDHDSPLSRFASMLDELTGNTQRT